MKTFGIYTLGCKVNMYESEYITNLLINHNYIKKDFNDTCDIYIINTCSVTNNSDSKSRKIIREASKKNTDAIVCVMGCYSQLNYDEFVDIIKGKNLATIIRTNSTKTLEKIKEDNNKKNINNEEIKTSE